LADGEPTAGPRQLRPNPGPIATNLTSATFCRPPHEGLVPVTGGDWTLEIEDSPIVRSWFADGLVRDLVLVFTLAGTTPAWP